MVSHEFISDRASTRPTAPYARAAAEQAGLLHLQRVAGNRTVSRELAEDHDLHAADLVGRAVASTGRPLDTAIRTQAEAHLGADLSHVRIHDDSDAVASAAAVQAEAYTSGAHVVFGRHGYDPVTDTGRRRIAHELTHVVQQDQGPVDGTTTAGGLQISDPDDRFERAAEASADAFASAGTGAVQREGIDEDDELVDEM